MDTLRLKYNALQICIHSGGQDGCAFYLTGGRKFMTRVLRLVYACIPVCIAMQNAIPISFSSLPRDLISIPSLFGLGLYS